LEIKRDIGSESVPEIISIVNKDLTFKTKVKDLTLKAKAKDLTSEQSEG